jgi:hypothetical protein
MPGSRRRVCGIAGKQQRAHARTLSVLVGRSVRPDSLAVHEQYVWRGASALSRDDPQTIKKRMLSVGAGDMKSSLCTLPMSQPHARM